MEIITNPDISLLDQVKMQAEVLVPVLRALRAELGATRANAIVIDALRAAARERYRIAAAAQPGSPREQWAALHAEGMPRIGQALDIQMLVQEAEAMEFDVTACRFAEFFRSIGEPELGAALLCENDLHLAAIGAPDVELTRTETIMQGCRRCDFRYRFRLTGSD